MQIPPLHTLTNESWHFWHVVASVLGGSAAQRVAVAIAKSMPPLPANANWWEQFFYSAVKAVVGIDKTGGN